MNSTSISKEEQTISVSTADLNPPENKRIGAVPSITKDKEEQKKNTTVAPVVMKIETNEMLSKISSEIPKTTENIGDEQKRKKSKKVKKHKNKDTGHESSSLHDSVLHEAGLLENKSDATFEQDVDIGKISKMTSDLAN